MTLTTLIVTLHVWLVWPAVWMTQANKHIHRNEEGLR